MCGVAVAIPVSARQYASRAQDKVRNILIMLMAYLMMFVCNVIKRQIAETGGLLEEPAGCCYRNDDIILVGSRCMVLSL